MKLPCEYYENHHSGEMLSKVSFDLGRMGDIFGSRFRRVVMPFMMVVVFLVPMFALSWQLTLCLVAVNTVLIGVTMVLTGPLKSLSKKMSESNSIMTKHITDLIQEFFLLLSFCVHFCIYPSHIKQLFMSSNLNYPSMLKYNYPVGILMMSVLRLKMAKI
jgi:ABC-type multidrug transport system fused ATPase/permease subunit